MMKPQTSIRCRAGVWALLAVLAAQVALAQSAIPLERPGDREFVLDVAGLLNPAQTQQIRELAERLLDDAAVPLIVVTLERKGDYGGGSMSIEEFARQLYDQWGIGHMTLDDTQYNRGILLLVARSDREARIELGGGYGRRMDKDAAWIMDNRIIPRFRADDYGAGIVAGSVALAQMARGELQTSGLLATAREAPWWQVALTLLIIVLAVASAISLHRRGKHGWAWAFWGIVLIAIWALIRASTRGSGRSGGGFGGGSFGGGRSGGGGATGRW
jgi:uncharacterized protein